MFNRILWNIKYQSRACLRSWSYQCESIFAQRSRRIQQVFTFYHQVYGTHGLKELFHSYKQIEPIRGFMMSAVGVVGLTVTQLNEQEQVITPNTTTSNTKTTATSEEITSNAFNWSAERLSMDNFRSCTSDIEFINTLARNTLCQQCKDKQMKYCYCLIGNRKCCNAGEEGDDNIEKCRVINHSENFLQADEQANAVGYGQAMITTTRQSAWQPYFSKNEFSIWKREERSDLYSYKVYARFDDISAEDLMHVQTDLEYRKQWDETAVTLELIEEDPSPGTNSHLIYWEMQWPKLFANRDYVYCRRFTTDCKQKVMMVCSRGTEHPLYPEISSKVRVKNYWSFMVIKPFRSFHEPGVHYVLTYYDDPGLSIPQSIKSWVTQKQMPDFLNKMYKATKDYACKRAIEMKKVLNLNSLNIKNDDYTANASRSR